MKLIIDISEYNREWINNAYRIPQEIDLDITRAIIDGEPLEPERKTGKWVKAPSRYFTPSGDPVWCCSECGKGMHVYGIKYKSYGADLADGQWVACPNCGAKMEN